MGMYMRFYACLYLLIAGVYLLTSSGRVGLSDSIAMLNVGWSMVEKGSLSSEPCQADPLSPNAGASVGCVPGARGDHYAAYGVIPSLAVAPVILTSKLAAHFARVNP